MTQEDIVQTILKDSNYHLSIFKKEEIEALTSKIFKKTVRGKESAFVKCIVRDKDIELKPEEIVRQLFATRLIQGYCKILIIPPFSSE
jgi:type I restriction enzyme M protein